jgi:hypothetical protein
MASRGMEHDILRVEGRALRRPPRRAGGRADLTPAEGALLTLMLGVFHDLRAKGRLIGELAGMTVEIRPRPLRHGTANAPATREIVTPVAGGQHGKGVGGDAGDGKTLSAAAERHLRESGGGIHSFVQRYEHRHATALPSTISAPTSSAVTSSSTARG